MKKLFLIAIVIFIFCSFSRVHVKTAPTLKVDTIHLPDNYKNRHFINDAQVLSADPASVPGNIVRYRPATSDYEFATLTALIKAHQTAVAQPVANGLIYKGEVSSSSNINGSDMIADLKAEKGQVLDIEIYDTGIYAVPEGQIDTASVKKALQSASADDRKNLFYITSATVSLINYKIHPEESLSNKLNGKADKAKKKLDDLSKNDTAKNGIYVKVKKQPKTKSPAELSSSATKVLNEKVLSIQITPVDDLLKK
ncbi:MAG TPA: hypothetical protein VHS53_17800 [Mucilaginibacter sp.]|jgi:hypothetical protein|nr:hypothetical protein [Mucilaginibacter sp.]